MSKSEIKLIIFDFDGTLVDTKKLYFFTIRKFLQKYGYKIPDAGLRRVLGMRMEFLLKKLKIDRKDADKISDDVNNAVVQNSLKLKPCPFIESVNRLGFRKILVTNSPRDFAMPTIRKYRLKFEKILGAEDFAAGKEHEFRRMFRIFMVKPHEAAYIGDRAEDAGIAHIAGCKSVILNNKYSWSGLKEILQEKPDAIVSSLKEIEKAVECL